MGSFSDFQGGDFYDDQAAMDAAHLSRQQSADSLSRGREAASLSDPFATERPQYKTALSTLLSNPGQIETSPFYKYLRDTQMEGVKASNAARGFTNSGRGLMALQDRAAGVASQAFFPLSHLYSHLAGADTGSPGAAGLAFSRGSERSQDYGQQALAQKNYQPPPGPAGPAWYDAPFFKNNGSSGSSSGLPSGGGHTPYYTDYSMPPSSGWDYGNTYDFSGGSGSPDEPYYDYAPEDYADYGDYWGDN